MTIQIRETGALRFPALAMRGNAASAVEFDALEAEVIAARSGKASLDLRIDDVVKDTINAAPAISDLTDTDRFTFTDGSDTFLIKRIEWQALRARAYDVLGAFIAGEVSKATLSSGDDFLIADTDAAQDNKRVSWATILTNIRTALGPTLIAGALNKATPLVTGDDIVIADSEDTNATKRVSWGQLQTSLGAASSGDLDALEAEVVAARSGSASLDIRIDLDRANAVATTNEVIVARSGLASLDERIDTDRQAQIATTNEVVAARSGAASLDARIDAIATTASGAASAAEFDALEAEVITARSGQASLDARIDPIAIEVAGARGTYTTIDARLDAEQAAFAEVKSEVITARSGQATLDDRIDHVANEVFYARGTYETLDDRLDAEQAAFAETKNEVITARSGSVSLDVRIDTDRQAAAATTAEVIAARDGAISLDARLDAEHGSIEDMPLSWRPGRNPRLFTLFESDDLTDGQVASTLVGTIEDWEPLDESLIAIDSQDGAEVRVSGERVIAMREPFRIETGRMYKLRAVVRRRTDTYDPAQDGVRIAVQGLNASQAGAVGAALIVATLIDLTVASGRVEVSAVLATAAGESVDLVAPAGAIYGRLYAQFWGSNPTTALQVLAVDDITDADVVAPDVDALQAQLDALLSEDTVTRIEALEATGTGSQIARYPTATDAAAATIGITIDLVETFGRVTIDDTEGGVYERALSEPAHAGKFQSVDGQWWEITPRDFNTVVDRAALAALPSSHKTVWLGELGREGWFRWNAANLSALVTLDPYQGIHVAPTSAPTGASGAWVRVRDKTFVNIDWFGAKEWSFGDFTANIQSALDFAGNEGGECYVPSRIYRQSATLWMKRSCWLHGSGNWAWGYRPLATLTGAYGSRLTWTDAVVVGAETMPQILVESDPQGQTLLHPRVSDLIVDGRGQCAYGVYISASITPLVENIHAESHIIASIAFLPRGNNTTGPTWDNIFTNTRTHANCLNSYGILMDSTGVVGYNTGGHGGYAHLQAPAPAVGQHTGWAFKLGNQDAFLMDKLEVFGFSPGAHAQSVWLSFDPARGGGAAKKHVFSYFAGGMIRMEKGCSALEVTTSSEGTVLDLHPDSSIIFHTMDQITGDSYKTLSYKFTDEYELKPIEAVLTGATLGVLGISQAIVLADAVNDGANWTHIAPPDWNHGRIVGLRIVYGMSVADPGTNCRLRVTIRCPRTNGTTSATGSDLEFFRTETFTVPAATVADTLYTADLEMAWPPEFKKRCAVVVNIQRMADGSETIFPDNSTQPLKIVAIRELYKTDGPNANTLEGVSATMGYWDTGRWSREVGYSESVGGPYDPESSDSYEAEATTLIAALDPTPLQLQQILINKTIKDLKTAGLWTAFDLFYFLGTQEEPWSYVNWIAPGTNNLVEVTASTRFTRLQGHRSMSNAYLSAGINWNALTKYTQNNCHAGAFVFRQAQAVAGSVFGSLNGNIAITPRTTLDEFVSRCNSTATDKITGFTDSRGHLMVNRTASNSYQQWVRGALAGTLTGASWVSVAPPAEPVTICKAVSLNIDHDVAAFHCGRTLTALEAVTLNRILSYHVGHMTG